MSAYPYPSINMQHRPVLRVIKLKPKQARAVELLGKLNDRRRAALEAHNARALLEIAAEYMTLGNHGGCPRMAAEITAEAQQFAPANFAVNCNVR